jgi:transposase
MTIKNHQVKLLMKKLKKNTLESAAAQSGMDVKSARKYIKSDRLPSDLKKPHNWSSHPDVFADDWDELKKMLETNPRLQAHTLINYLVKRSPEKYKPCHLRTLQRRIRDWRAQYGASKAVIFSQDIQPGKQSQSDFTNMNDLFITINHQSFNHLLFHFVLPYSRWEAISLCFSESFESLVAGFENSIWKLGYVAGEHRTDNLTAATQAMGSQREFTERWQLVMKHYQIRPTTNNPGVSHENGSIEKSHDTLKNAVDQALMLRGSRDFSNQNEYMKFVQDIVDGRNAYRLAQFEKEEGLLLELPERKWHSPIVINARVSSSSVIQILNKPYTVPSRLIHYTIRAYVYPDEIILFYGTKQLQRMPRNYSDDIDGINYRHIIDGLVRKPGAFANYKYQEALFPRLCFRKAYDSLYDARPATADKTYLKLLQLAKIQSEQGVADAIELLLEDRQLPTLENVKELMDSFQKERQLVRVNQPNLADYDRLLSCNDFTQRSH